MTREPGILRRCLHRLRGGRELRRHEDAMVVFDLDYSNGHLFIVLTNTGCEPALDVSIAFDGPVRGLGGTRDFAELPLFRRLPVLRPRREIRLFFDAGSSINQIGRFTATACWSSPDGKYHELDYAHDAAVFRDWPELFA